MDERRRDVYALAIGRIAIAWNEYHEQLGYLFARFFTKSHYNTALAIWHCLDSDRTQRRLLRSAAATHLSWNTKGLEELNWLLNKTDHVIAMQRNVGIHAPLSALFDVDGTEKLLPVPGPGNRNAKQLDGKEVLAEYAHYELQIRRISEFASALRFKLVEGRYSKGPWPTRPKISSSPN